MCHNQLLQCSLHTTCSENTITVQLRPEGPGHALHRPTTLAYLRSAGTGQRVRPAVDCAVSVHGSCTAGLCVPGTGWHVPLWSARCTDQTAYELQTHLSDKFTQLKWQLLNFRQALHNVTVTLFLLLMLLLLIIISVFLLNLFIFSEPLQVGQGHERTFQILLKFLLAKCSNWLMPYRQPQNT